MPVEEAAVCGSAWGWLSRGGGGGVGAAFAYPFLIGPPVRLKCLQGLEAVYILNLLTSLQSLNSFI